MEMHNIKAVTQNKSQENIHLDTNHWDRLSEQVQTNNILNGSGQTNFTSLTRVQQIGLV